jgi:hypothetical protein
MNIGAIILAAIVLITFMAYFFRAHAKSNETPEVGSWLDNVSATAEAEARDALREKEISSKVLGYQYSLKYFLEIIKDRGFNTSTEKLAVVQFFLFNALCEALNVQFDIVTRACNCELPSPSMSAVLDGIISRVTLLCQEFPETKKLLPEFVSQQEIELFCTFEGPKYLDAHNGTCPLLEIAAELYLKNGGKLLV